MTQRPLPTLLQTLGALLLVLEVMLLLVLELMLLLVLVLVESGRLIQ
jgi:hypothetical protein